MNGGAPNETEIASSLQTAAACLVALDTLLGLAPFLAGEFVSLADLHAFPILRYFCLAPEGHAALRLHPALLRWYESMLTRDSISRTTTKYELAAPA